MNGIQAKYRTSDLKKGDEIFLKRGGRAGVISTAREVSREGEKALVEVLSGPGKGGGISVFDADIDWEKGTKHNG